MRMVRWSPLREMAQLNDRLNRIMSAEATSEEVADRIRWVPRVDIFEDEEGISLSFELPGFQKDDIDIEVTGDVLTISGERQPPDESIRDGYRRIERQYGPFRRSLSLPDTVDGSLISARYKLGVLTLLLPRAEKAKPKKINVEIG